MKRCLFIRSAFAGTPVEDQRGPSLTSSPSLTSQRAPRTFKFPLQLCCAVLGLCAATLSLTSKASAATDWYVDDSAAAGGNGSSTSPFQTILQGYNAAAAGDTVKIMPGTYNFASTLSVSRKVYFAGTNDAYSSSYAIITGTWNDRATVTDQTIYGRELFTVNSSAAGTKFTNLRFTGGTGPNYSDKKIGTGINILQGANDVTIDRCQMNRFCGPCVHFNTVSRLQMLTTNLSDSGYEATTATSKAVGGCVQGQKPTDCLFKNMVFFNSAVTGDGLGVGGYGFKLTLETIRTTFDTVTFDLKTKSAWSPGGYPTSNFGIEITRPSSTSPISCEDNAIKNCTIKNTLSIGLANTSQSVAGKRTFSLSNNTFQVKGDYCIEGQTDKMLVENNYSSQRDFWSNHGSDMQNNIIRFNICEGITGNFLSTLGSAQGLQVYNNTVSVTGSGAKLVILGGSDVVNFDHSAWSRTIRNNVFINNGSGTATMVAVRSGDTPSSDFRGTLIQNNYAFNANIGSLAAATIQNNLTGTSSNPGLGSLFNLTPAPPLTISTANQYYYPKAPLWDKGIDVGSGDTKPDIGKVQHTGTLNSPAHAAPATSTLSPSGGSS